MPSTAPWSPTQRYHGCGAAASTASRAGTAGGSTESRYSCGCRANSSIEGRLTTRAAIASAARRSEDDQVGDRAQCGELLDRLMRGTVLPEADRVVREDVDHRQVGQRSEADRRPHVIRKNEERRADRPDAAVQGESVQDCAHPMLAHAEMDITRAPPPGRHVAPVLEGEVRRGREVRRPTYELGGPGREGVQQLPRRLARGLGIGGGGEGGREGG